MPETIGGKLWVSLLLFAAVGTEFRNYETYGDGFGLAFLIDLLIRVVFYYAFYYSLPVSVYTRQRNYFKNKKDKKND